MNDDDSISTLIERLYIHAESCDAKLSMGMDVRRAAKLLQSVFACGGTRNIHANQVWVKCNAFSREDGSTREVDQITVVIADMHLTCDADPRFIRLAKRLADDHQAPFLYDKATEDMCRNALGIASFTNTELGMTSHVNPNSGGSFTVSVSDNDTGALLSPELAPVTSYDEAINQAKLAVDHD